MSKIFISFSFFSILLGCATTTTSQLDSSVDKRLVPPSSVFLNKWKNSSIADLEKLQTGSNEENIYWWKTYMLASSKKDSSPIQSCQGFKSLSSVTDFPLHDLALLRAYQVCPKNETLPSLPSSVATWYRDLYTDIKLKESSETEDPLDDVVSLGEKARFESNKKKKEEFYLKALEISQKVGNKEKTAELQDLLYKNSPRLNPLPTFKDLSAVAADYRFHREFNQALDTYKKILESKEATPEDTYSALKNIRQTYKVAQRRNDYINATAELVNWTKTEFNKNKKSNRSMSRYHDAQVLFARTLWTEDQTSQAIKVLNETHRLLRGLYPMDEVYFILGRMEEEKGNFTKALEYFEASFKEPISQAGLRDKIAWMKSWNYYKLGKWEEAKNSFTQMKETVKDPSDKNKARFWLARSLKQLGLNLESEKELQGLISEDPLGYYGVLAFRELNKTFPGIKNNNTELEGLSLFNVDEIGIPTRLTTEWLISVNEKVFAEKVLNGVVEEFKKNNVAKENSWLAISSGYARTGLYLPLFSTLGSLQPNVKDKLLNDHPDLLFPQIFNDIIANASKQSGVPQEFIFSIIRQESAFNPEARSSVDAFGLMQLLPNIAKQLAKRNSIEFKDDLDLFKPEVNIPLGALELKNLLKKYNNQFILAVSGYNANDGAIRGWLKTRYRQDPVEFIEEVPYEETRTYIKLVMRNYVFYQRLLNPDKTTLFPEVLLTLPKMATAN
ncbi:MAG: tetratricopeptide repeat protein [Bdellovibrio sp.]